jgi:hypothetical protein
MRWLVTGQLGKRKRYFNVHAVTLEQAKNDALHLLTRHYVINSGEIGNSIWQTGTVTISCEGMEPVVLIDDEPF